MFCSVFLVGGLLWTSKFSSISIRTGTGCGVGELCKVGWLFDLEADVLTLGAMTSVHIFLRIYVNLLKRARRKIGFASWVILLK